MAEKIYNEINLGILKNVSFQGKKVLDVGCSSGLLGYEIKKLGNFVYGVDISIDELEKASGLLDEVKRIDLNDDLFDISADFEVMIMADILEHFENPARLLVKLKSYLNPDGLILISIPNIACFNARIGLFLGQFNYKNYGLMDSTHLRFFTKKTAIQLVQENGFRIEKIDVTPFLVRPIFRFWRRITHKDDTSGDLENRILNSKPFFIYKRWIFPLEHLITKLWPGLLAYQFIIIARKLE